MESKVLDKTFEMNSKAYQTDGETLALLRQAVPMAKAGNNKMLSILMTLGLKSGCIVEIGTV